MSTNDISIIGERFVFEHYPKLFRRLRIMKTRWNTISPGLPYTEGADIEAWTYPIGWPENGFSGFTEPETDISNIRIVKGPIEVKTSRFNQYIAFDNQKVDKICGALPFPIWNSYKDDPLRARLGNLYRMFYPKDNKKERQPLAYVAVFLDTTKRPYAALVFEDFLALKERLIEIGKECGLDLTEEGMNKIPCEQELKGWVSTRDWMNKMMEDNPRLLLTAEMWYVKMSEVIDLATVVLIGDPPRSPRSSGGIISCPKQVQESRWNYLKEHRCGNPIPLVADDETKTIIQQGNRLFEWFKNNVPLIQDETTGETEKRLLFL